MDSKILFILVINGLLLFGVSSAATYTCNSCSNCTARISSASSGDTVYLTKNITDQSENCIAFDHIDGITFDCQGNNISGVLKNYLYGIYLQDSSNNIIKNCNVSLFYYGIYLSSSNNNTLTKNAVNGNYYNGIYLVDSNNNTVVENTVNDNQDSGIEIQDSNNSTLINNTANNNRYYGIYTYYSNISTLAGNTANYNKHCGIAIFYSNISTLTGNTANYNKYGYEGYGIVIMDSTNNIPTNNTANNNEYYGIVLSYSNISTLAGNTANYNRYYGIYIHYSNFSTLTRNTANSNGQLGVYIYFSDDNNLTNNTANYNEYKGIFLHASNNNTLISNKINKSSGQGGLSIGGYTLPHFQLNITTSNTINGVPIQYYDGTYRTCPNNEVLEFDLSNQNVSHVQLVGCDNVTIRNLNTTLDGIYLSYTNNSRIENCVSSDNYEGIQLSYSNNNIIIENTANSNRDGIDLYNSNNSILSGNIADNNSWDGISLSESNNNTIIDNTANFNSGEGLLLHGSNNNVFTNNIMNDNEDEGVYLWISDTNTFTNNTINNNGDGISIGLNSTSNIFTNNIVNYNSGYGVYMNLQLQQLNANTFNLNNICYNTGTDIAILSGLTSGDLNTCDTTANWDDIGTTGCTYSCSNCTDSDGDKNYYVKGTATGSAAPSTQSPIQTKSDVCILMQPEEEPDDYGWISYKNTYDSEVNACYGADCELVEYYCRDSDDALSNVVVNCPGGCTDGACLSYEQSEECIDTDDGEDIYEKGLVYYTDDNQIIGVVDRCRFGSEVYYTAPKLMEYTCGDVSYIECPNGCQDGACISICDLAGDNPPCGEVTLAEVIDFINLWVQDQASLSNVINLINAWASG